VVTALPLRHLSAQQIADQAEGRLAADQRAPVHTHLAACERCATAVARVERLIGLMRTDAGEDAPPHVVARAVRLFRPEPGLGHAAVQRLVAVLRFDSAGQPAVPGLRTGGPAARSLLYSAGDYDIDLRITASGAMWSIAGQILGPEIDGYVEMERVPDSLRAAINDLGEFTLPSVPAGLVTLRVFTSGRAIEIPTLELGPSDGAA
jgi:hypothetical protein